MGRNLIAALVVAGGLWGCSTAPMTPLALADAATSAAYAGDERNLQAHFSDDLKHEVSTEQVGAMSSQLHAFGAYHGLAEGMQNAEAHRYEFAARFDGASIPVRMRLDERGRIAAFRILIPAPPAH